MKIAPEIQCLCVYVSFGIFISVLLWLYYFVRSSVRPATNHILRTATEASLIKFYREIKHNKRVITRFRFDAHGPGHNPVSGHNVSNWVLGITYIFI